MDINLGYVADYSTSSTSSDSHFRQRNDGVESAQALGRIERASADLAGAGNPKAWSFFSLIPSCNQTGNNIEACPQNIVDIIS